MSKLRSMLSRHAPIVAFVLVCVFMTALTASAQTATPEPTAVPTDVMLTVDTNAMFTSANEWIVTFTPIIAIGIGIAIALAVLTFVGAQIIKAFRSPGG